MTINIELPHPDIRIINDGRSTERRDYNSLKEWQHFYRYQDYFEEVDETLGGLYLIYVEEGSLYIGRTISMKKRIKEHFAGSTPLKRYIKDFTKVECMFIQDIADQEIYEAYAIKIYKPILNIAKTNKSMNDIGNHLSDEQVG